VLKTTVKSVEVCLYTIYYASTRNKYLHHHFSIPPLKEAQIMPPFDIISKSGDGGHSGGILHTVATFTESRRKVMTLMITVHLMMKANSLKTKIRSSSFRIT
jgi:hypothetical protein